MKLTLQNSLKTLLKENISDNIWYHGSRTLLPFQNFDPKMDGSGVVSNGGKYGGFFFTSEQGNAEFYAEDFVMRTKINNVYPNPTDSKHSSSILKLANEHNKSYFIHDVLDGSEVSDVVVVPTSRISDIQPIDWLFVGDRDFYFQRLDQMFGNGEDDDFITQDMIDDTCGMIDINLSYLLTIPIFKEYYESK